MKQILSSFIVLLLAFIMAACTPDQPQPTATVATRPQVTVTLPPRPATATPTPLPDGTTPSTGSNTIPAETLVGPAVLPAGIYFLNEQGQIARVERDGQTVVSITNETTPIDAYDVSPDGRYLAYVSNNSLIQLDLSTGQRLIKVTGPATDDFLEKVQLPSFSADSKQIAFGLKGINVVPAGDSTSYQTLLPSDPNPMELDEWPEGPTRFYYRANWSPDGSRMGVAFSYFPEGGGVGILNLADNSFVPISVADFNVPTCCELTWSPDGQTAYIASEQLIYGTPGLAQVDLTTGVATRLVSGTAAENSESSWQMRLFKDVYPQPDGALLTLALTAYSMDEIGRYPYYYFLGEADPANDDIKPLEYQPYTFRERPLWASDGLGFIQVDTAGDPDAWSGQLRWVSLDGYGSLNMPATGNSPRWAGPAQPTDLPSKAEITQLTTELQTSWGDASLQPLSSRNGRLLYAAFSTGMRFDRADGQHHLALYTYNGTWQQLAETALEFQTNAQQPEPSPDYLGPYSINEAFIEPNHLWLTVDGGVGAHGGAFQLIRFDDQQFTLHTNSFNPSPGAGYVHDLDGDGWQEVILDGTDPYIFAYAAGVRRTFLAIQRWDGNQLVDVTLTPLPESAPEPVRQLTNQAISYAEAELWADASIIMQEAFNLMPDDPAVGWNWHLIRINSDARLNANSSYPILSPYVFAGTYWGAIGEMRQYAPSQIFTLQSPLIVNTSAQGFEEYLIGYILEHTNKALAVKPDLAPAYFVRGWAKYLANPDDPSAAADIQRAADLDPDDPLFADSAAYLR